MAETGEVLLNTDDLRAVTGFAAGCAGTVLGLYASAHPADPRPRDAIDAAWAFARGGRRGKALRDTAWAALRAAGETDDEAAEHAARAAMAAASAAYLHPLADAHQVKHVLGAPAHAARAAELAAGGDEDVAVEHLARARERCPAEVVAVLVRFPAAPAGGGRVGKLLRDLDEVLRRVG
ncbi:putative immunity protein [Actinomycetospora sp. CA-101289]|uniref:putative immunity protein n=1 Tax=Actinomycetospora sp. CA-101289 TaxID=3239893 RepID=UPI003D98734C